MLIQGTSLPLVRQISSKLRDSMCVFMPSHVKALGEIVEDGAVAIAEVPLGALGVPECVHVSWRDAVIVVPVDSSNQLEAFIVDGVATVDLMEEVEDLAKVIPDSLGSLIL